MKNWLVLYYWQVKKKIEKSLHGRRLLREVIFLKLSIVSIIFLFLTIT